MKKFLAVLAFLILLKINGYCQTLQTVTDNGNTTSDRVVVGGVDDGTSQLQVKGSITLNCGINNISDRPPITNGTSSFEIRARSGDGYSLDDGFLRLSAGGGISTNAKSYIDISGYSTKADMTKNIVFGTGGIERMRIDPGGNIGIGTKWPDAKLAVNGTIHAKQVKVNLSGWPDYIFDSSSTLPSLNKLRQYIELNHHLPGIPSAREIEGKGMDLGNMQKKQMEKIEELSLYLIRQNELIVQLMQKVDQLDRQVKKLKTKRILQ